MTPATATESNDFQEAPIPEVERVFLVHGWRWHTRAVLRDVVRFRKVILNAVETSAGSDVGEKQVQAAVERVLKGYRYLWTFSFAKLHKCETSFFFPWLRNLLPEEALPPLEDFEGGKGAVNRIGHMIGQLVDEALKASKASSSPRAALLQCVDLSSELEQNTSALSRAQEAAIVPVTSAYVSAKEQRKFNDKVILSLGLLDSHVLLVAMYDAIRCDDKEMDNFRKQVPKFARALIPTWRRMLYSPKAGCLDEKTANVEP